MFNKIVVWLIVLFVSLALILTSFDFTKRSSEKKIITINKYSVSNDEMNLLISVIRSNHLDLKYINDSEVSIKSKLIDIVIIDLRLNLKLAKLGLFVLNSEIKNEILSSYFFVKNDKFDIDLYKNFLLKNNLTDFTFQKNVSNKLRINKFKKITNVICNNQLLNNRNILTYKKYNIIHINNKIFIKHDHLYEALLSKHDSNIVNLDIVNVSVKSIIERSIVTNILIKDIYNKNEHIYTLPVFVYVDHFIINKRIKNYSIILSLLKCTRDFSSLKHNNDLVKRFNLLIDFKEFNKQFRSVVKKFNNSIIFFESVNDLHVLMYKKHAFIDKKYLLLNDLKNKCKKEQAKNILLANKLAIDSGDFDCIVEKLILPSVNLTVTPYVKVKMLNILKENIKHTIIKIDKYNYFILKINGNYFNNNINCNVCLDINRYLEAVKMDKIFLSTFCLSKINIYDVSGFKIVSSLYIKKHLEYKKMLKCGTQYYYFNIDKYANRYFCNYKRIKDILLNSN